MFRSHICKKCRLVVERKHVRLHVLLDSWQRLQKSRPWNAITAWLSNPEISGFPAISAHVHYFATGRGANYCDQRVCLSVRTHPNFTNFPYMLKVAVARSSSADNAICYVLPVLWMTSCFHITGQCDRIKDDVVSSSSPGGCEV